MPIDLPLDANAVRVLGALMEKEVTTPDQYPLTINAITAACNQTSNREPVMSLDEAIVMDTVASLSKQNLVREVMSPGSRAKRFRQSFTESLHLHSPESAIMCVLMLRGPQTTGEIRTRTTRMHEFDQLAQVEITLQNLAAFEPPLVIQLPRQPGQKEVRYGHLLSGEPVIPVHDAPVHAARAASHEPSRLDKLEAEVAALREEVRQLRQMFE